MDRTKIDLPTEECIVEVERELHDLSDLQLAFVGGGIGDTII